MSVRLVVSLVVAWVAFLLIVVFGLPARAHSWYPSSCCSGKDCRELAEHETPIERDGGFAVLGRHHFGYREIKQSPDGKWHLCETQSADLKKRVKLCLFGPMGGF